MRQPPEGVWTVADLAWYMNDLEARGNGKWPVTVNVEGFPGVVNLGLDLPENRDDVTEPRVVLELE